jgi:serine/threonine-protein kinase
MPHHPKPDPNPQAAEPEEMGSTRLVARKPDTRTDPPAGAERGTGAADARTADPAGAPSLAGQHFGDYELLREIGRGGMGVVYKARQKSLERVVAVKMLREEHFRNPAVLTRFLAEARGAAGLTHRNIVTVYQVGECFFGHYYVMEYINGKSLAALLENGPLPIAATVALLIPVAEAVHYAHSKGIIHRDLKPANIMVDRRRRPVVMDFGIAKFVGRASPLTLQGTILGTPAYMPPEQADEDLSQVGPPSDVYSLGAILYTMLTGRVPYDEGTALRTLLKVLSPDLPPPVRSFRPEVPAALEQVCLQCLSKRPADRFPTAQALAEALRQVRPTTGGGQISTLLAAHWPSAFLVTVSTGKVVRLRRQDSVIGRASECDIILRAADVSKRHCQIYWEADELLVEDLGSANGTCVNGRPVTRCRLQDGDRLEIAGHAFQVRLPRP